MLWPVGVTNFYTCYGICRQPLGHLDYPVKNYGLGLVLIDDKELSPSLTRSRQWPY